MILYSSIIRLDRLPELILLKIFNYVIASDWSDVFKLGGVNRMFRTFAASYIWPDFKELHIMAKMDRHHHKFEEITVNGVKMSTLCINKNGLTRQFKTFLNCFLHMATKLETLRLYQNHDIDLLDRWRCQGLHQLFNFLAQKQGLAKKIIIAFDTVCVVYDTHFCNSFAKLIKSAPKVELVSGNMLDACQRVYASRRSVFPKLEILTISHFFNAEYHFIWDRIFKGLPNLREMNLATSWSNIPGNSEYALDYFLSATRKLFDCFQNAYTIKPEKTCLNFYFEQFDRNAPQFFSDKDLPEKLRSAMTGEIATNEDGYTLTINNGNCKIRLTFTLWEVLW